MAWRSGRVLGSTVVWIGFWPHASVIKTASNCLIFIDISAPTILSREITSYCTIPNFKKKRVSEIAFLIHFYYSAANRNELFNIVKLFTDKLNFY